MAKLKTVYFCQSCGFQSPKWLGKCTSCNSWDTMIEEVVDTGKQKPAWNNDRTNPLKAQNQATRIQDIVYKENMRLEIPDSELSRVLGGGIVPGSLILLGGEPGIGKSTLLLQLALQIENVKVLYVSGEESEVQIKMRADRIGIINESCYLLSETNLQSIFQQVNALEPDILILDSIQTIYSSQIESAPGSVSQIRECTADLMRYAKETATPTFIVGHITKDGAIAGPKVLEHMVDTVLQFEGDRNHLYRMVRSIKNRFGASSEMAIYEMKNFGLIPVENPSEVLISSSTEPFSGITISVNMEGTRPILIETQALVSSAVYGTPQRSTTGFDQRRMNMLLAVIEKKCGFKIGAKDVFLNITGGIRIEDPGADLGIVMAILSSSLDIPVHHKIAFCAEVGLSGEIRPVSRIEQRISEAQRLGLEKIFISEYNAKGIDLKALGIEVRTAKKIEDVYYELFT